METFSNGSLSHIKHADYPSFEQGAATNPDDSSLGLMELSLNLRNQLNSLKSIKKNFSHRFESFQLSSEKKDQAKENINFEQKYRDTKSKYNELEELHSEKIQETIETLKRTRTTHDSKIKSLEEELVQKNSMIEILKQGDFKSQEKISVLENRISSLENLNATLTLQLKDRSKEVSGAVDGIGSTIANKAKDLAAMKSDFARIVDRIAGLEDIIKNLKEGKKQDNRVLEETARRYEELKVENFQLLMDNKRIKNELDESTNKFASLDKCYAERKQKTEEFIKTLNSYENSFQVINQVNLDLEKMFEPLKEQNRKLIEAKQKLLEENSTMKITIANFEAKGQKSMEIEGEDDGKNNTKNGSQKGINHEFYVQIMERFKDFEKKLEVKDKEIDNVQSELDEVKARNLELETKMISMNRSPIHRFNVNNDKQSNAEVNSHFTLSPSKKKNINSSPNEVSGDKRFDYEEKDASLGVENHKEVNQNTLEEENSERDARLIINRKPKPAAKKNMNTFNLLTGINICPNCSLIIKKSDKGLKDCSKCHTHIHEKCVADQDGDEFYCNACALKMKKASQNRNADDAVNEEKEVKDDKE